MDYICKVLNKIGYKVLIVSPSKTSKKNFFKGKLIKINNDITLKLFHTFPWGNKFQKAFSLIAGNFMLFWYLLFNVKRNETILVYHSLGLNNTVRYAKKIRGFKVILEVEEIYQDVMSCSAYTRKSEFKTFREADKYIFSTEALNEKLNKKNKPFSVIYGTYEVEYDRYGSFDDDRIHAVYAGIIDSQKGATAVALAAKYLDFQYHIHIIGFGAEDNVKKLKELIYNISPNTECKLTYDGLLIGEEYIQFLQKCDIGLCTQTPKATYTETSFPSKIMSYMANGLRVLSIRINTIEKSKVGDKIFYYDKDTPKSIAENIKSIDFSKAYDSRLLINQLNNEFEEGIQKLLNVNFDK
jgi:hypothetical protein